MKCPLCGADTRTLETRDTRRRRECFNEHRFTTVETVVHEDLMALKRGRPVRPRRDLQKFDPVQ